MKDTGAYYTPQELSDFMVEHSLKRFKRAKTLSFLEPSCGDGVFVEAINKYLKNSPNKSCAIDCVEIDECALANVKVRPHDKLKSLNLINKDFLEFFPGKRKRYDLIIGNPPYVVRKRLPKKTIEACKDVYAAADLFEKNFRNLWSIFLIEGINLLSESGVLAYVLPAELLQVKFSEELRKHLTKVFDRVEVISFKELVFEGIEQDTILLFCYKKHSDTGLFFSQKKNTGDLQKNEVKFKKKDIKIIQAVKWTSHVLTQEELALLLRLKARFRPISDYCSAVAGIVTAANNYFIVDDEIIEKYELDQYALPIIQRGIYVNGSAVFTKENYKQLKDGGRACHLLDFSTVCEESLSTTAKSYLELGESQEINLRYKCRKRPIWYSVPGIWKSEGFFFKRSHLYPKLLKNQAGVMVTDSAYRIKMFDGYCINSLVYSFYNSLTLSLAELGGRFYGGGVLELTPNEFKSIAIPYLSVDKHTFSNFSNSFEHKNSIEEISAVIDEQVLIQKYGLSLTEVKKLQKIKAKLTGLRLGKL